MKFSVSITSNDNTPPLCHYDVCLSKCRHYVETLLTMLPDEWHIPRTVVEEKLIQLFETEWTDGVWNNFIECLNEYYINGKIKI